jgi:hypothetical protein
MVDTVHHHRSLGRICVFEWRIHIGRPRFNLRLGVLLQEPLRVQNGPGLTADLTDCLLWSTRGHGLHRTGNLLSVAFSEVAWRSRWLIDCAHLVAEDGVDDSQPPFPVDCSTSDQSERHGPTSEPHGIRWSCAESLFSATTHCCLERTAIIERSADVETPFTKSRGHGKTPGHRKIHGHSKAA